MFELLDYLTPEEELDDLRQAVEMIEDNLLRGRLDPLQQATLRDVHLARIKELEKKCQH